MKRFTETTKWGDPWYRKLSPKLKALWQYLTDSCDCAGVIEPDWQVISLQIGDNVSDEDLVEFGDRIVELSSGKLWLTKFVEFQYGELSDECRAHGPVFKAIQKHGLDRVSKGYPKGINTLKDKYKDKDKVQDKKEEGRGEKQNIEIPECLAVLPEFAAEWKNYLDQRKAKGKAFSATARSQELILTTLSEQPQRAVQGLRKAIERRWTGFEWIWLENGGHPKGGGTAPQNQPTSKFSWKPKIA